MRGSPASAPASIYRARVRRPRAHSDALHVRKPARARPRRTLRTWTTLGQVQRARAADAWHAQPQQFRARLARQARQARQARLLGSVELELVVVERHQCARLAERWLRHAPPPSTFCRHWTGDARRFTALTVARPATTKWGPVTRTHRASVVSAKKQRKRSGHSKTSPARTLARTPLQPKRFPVDRCQFCCLLAFFAGHPLAHSPCAQACLAALPRSDLSAAACSLQLVPCNLSPFTAVRARSAAPAGLQRSRMLSSALAASCYLFWLFCACSGIPPRRGRGPSLSVTAFSRSLCLFGPCTLACLLARWSVCSGNCRSGQDCWPLPLPWMRRKLLTQVPASKRFRRRSFHNFPWQTLKMQALFKLLLPHGIALPPLPKTLLCTQAKTLWPLAPFR